MALAGFKDILFPETISYGSVGGPKFATDIIEVDSGFEQRLARWAQGRNEYNVSFGVRTQQDLQALVSFFRNVRGEAYAFRYKDWLDFLSIDHVGQNPPSGISNVDQPIGTGNDIKSIFQLSKTYTYETEIHVRNIFTVRASTLLVALNASTITNFTLDDQAGTLTFTPRESVTGTDIGFTTGTNVIDSTSTDLSVFVNGDHIRITNSTSNNTPTTVGADFFTITGTPTTNAMTTTDVLTTEGAGATVTIDVHPALQAGDALTAGYEFDTPCRFATSQLPVSIDMYGAGSATNIPVIEIRPCDVTP